VRFYFTGIEFLYDYNANLSKAVATKMLPLTILWNCEEQKLNFEKQRKYIAENIPRNDKLRF